MTRSLDWVEDIDSDLWAFPAGMERSGAPDGREALTWTSKYGSVVASGYDMSVRCFVGRCGGACAWLGLAGRRRGLPWLVGSTVRIHRTCAHTQCRWTA